MSDEKRKCKYQHPVQSAHYILRPVIQKSVSFAGIDSGTAGLFFGGYSISFVFCFYGNNERTVVELTTLQKSGVYVENTLEDLNVAF